MHLRLRHSEPVARDDADALRIEQRLGDAVRLDLGMDQALGGLHSAGFGAEAPEDDVAERSIHAIAHDLGYI